MLSSKQRAALRAIANREDTILYVGKSGITPNIEIQARDALRARELIKGRVLENSLYTAKEAADLHSNIFAQYCLYDYVIHNDLHKHIYNIRHLYKEQCEAMIKAMETYLPKDITFTRPEGGMFLWASLPEGQSAKDLFDRAIKKKVAFVPGDPFYTDGRVANTMRLNYTNASIEVIEEGIRRIGELL